MCCPYLKVSFPGHIDKQNDNFHSYSKDKNVFNTWMQNFIRSCQKNLEILQLGFENVTSLHCIERDRVCLRVIELKFTWYIRGSMKHPSVPPRLFLSVSLSEYTRSASLNKAHRRTCWTRGHTALIDAISYISQREIRRECCCPCCSHGRSLYTRLS